MGSFENTLVDYLFSGEESAESIQKSMDSNGFVVIKGCFSLLDIKNMQDFYDLPENRSLFLNFNKSKVLPGASHLIKGFDKVITNQKLISFIRKLVPGDVAYTSHSDLHMGLSAGWHKDDGNGEYFKNMTDYFENEDCRVYKVGVYLRDCSEYGGLSVRLGSHSYSDKTTGAEYYIPSELGDAIIFDVRVTHKGWVKKRNIIASTFFKIMRKLFKNKFWESVPFDRKSMFFTYGLKNKYTEMFSKTNMDRQNQQNGRKLDIMPEDLKNSLRSSGIYHYFS